MSANSSVRRRHVLAALCVTASFPVGAPPVHSQFAVIDSANLVQTVLTAKRSLDEINNQIIQIQQFIQMLQNEAFNLTSLPFSIVQQLDQSISQITSLMGQAQGILYNIQNVQSQFQRYYPTSIDAGVPDAQLTADAQTRWQYSLASFQHTMEVQSQIVQDMPNDQASMNGLVAQSQGAVGILQATQAGTQIVALQAKQISALQTLIATQARSQAIEQARQAEAEEQAHEQYQRFLGQSPGVYSPVPVVMFH